MIIKNYSLVVEYTPEALVSTVTNACGKGFQPLGGISITREAANPKKNTEARTAYAQAMIKLYTPHDAAQEVVARVNGN